jgi:pyruvate/2-oxoglutarate dehydrogenase complex dihydrolipoamide dehydrogenase (E3) component
MRFQESTTVLQASRYGRVKTVTVQQEGRRTSLEFDEILACSGRLPDIEGLGLDKAGVKAYGGGVLVDSMLRTSQKHIFAAGDVVGKQMAAGTAEHHAAVVVDNILGIKRSVDARLPRIVHTEPMLASVGLLEGGTETRRTVISSHAGQGHVKVLCESGAGEIQGCSIVGPHAAEFLQVFTLAMQEGIPLRKLGQMPRAYPLLSTSLAALGQDDRGALRKLFSMR